MPRIESFLAARLFMQPQPVGGDVYFISNLSGRLSLYRMRAGGSVPQPLIPPDIALPNPDLIGGASFCAFPGLGQILLMCDSDGDEVYRPFLLPLDGGFPEPYLPEVFSGSRAHCTHIDEDALTAYFLLEAEAEPMQRSIQVNLANNEVTELAASTWGYYPADATEDQQTVALVEGYTVGDTVLYVWRRGVGLRCWYGKPLHEREEGETVPLTSFNSAAFVGDRGLLVSTALFDDHFSAGYVPLDEPGRIFPVAISGAQHSGEGELEGIEHCTGNRFRVSYNIDGVSWLYEGVFDDAARTLNLDTVICGTGELVNGKLEGHHYEKPARRYALSFSTATSPTQIYTVDAGVARRHTDERVLGIDPVWLSAGEDASFVSHDGLRISARLYLPAAALGFTGPRPLVYYVHGGPQSQERPDFAWFSMPLIQFLTLNGFAVFVPNARGSTGYGLQYTKFVDHDWGGQDRLDHVHAMTVVLPQDKRLDTARAGVVGRSYGGYMTLTLAARHPELWSAAVDMFGPYDLLSFSDRIPETWKPYFAVALGDPVADRDFLVERSPSTYIEQITCPLLVIQGRNDPRVVASESADVVARLRAAGRDVDFLVFEDEGHDVLKFANRVRCYNAITDFFSRWLG